MSRTTPGGSGIHFCRAWVVRPWVRFFERLGSPVERFLLESHLSPDLFEDDDAAVPLRLAVNFADRASRAEGVGHVGLRVAQSLTLDDLGSLRTVLLHSRNLYEYLESACRLVGSISTAARYAVTLHGDTARFHHSTLEVGDLLHGHLFTLGATIQTLRQVAGADWTPEAVVVPAEEADGMAEASDAFENVRADPTARSASFDFPLSFLTLPAPAVDTAATQDPGEGLEQLDEGGFRPATRRLVESLVLDGLADVHTAADAAGMSVRTFQRRLAACDLVYSRLVQEARIGLAERWLLTEDRSVEDIARSLGYTHPANFTRAFRRLNGVPPSVFRASRTRNPRVPRKAASGSARHLA